MKSLLRFRSFLFTACVCTLVSLPISAQNVAGSNGQNASTASQAATTAIPADGTTEYVLIPGPLRSFLRMSALSQKVSPEEVLPLLAHHVAVYGYEGSKTKAGKSTEYLTLLERYIQRGKEMEWLAGKQENVHIENCAASGPLLEIIWYRLRSACGPDTSLETNDAERAFITIDSGFPLVELEETLRGGKPFDYAYPSSRVPVLFSAKDWTSNGKDFLETLVKDPVLSRLYWAMSQMDADTRNELEKSPGIQKLIPLASTLEYYAPNVSIRGGKVLVPGGAAAESAWKTLVGVSPTSPAEFVTLLMSKDNGWLAAYFDSLGRVSQTQQAYFTDPARIGKFYQAM